MKLFEEVMEALIKQFQYEEEEKELHWLTEYAISPQICQIIDTLNLCLELIGGGITYENSVPEQKLPLSSSKLEALKGTITRKGASIANFDVSVDDNYFNKCFSQLKLVKPVRLPQIEAATKAMKEAIKILEHLREISSIHAEKDNHPRIISGFHSLLDQIYTAKLNMLLPTDPKLVFPLHVIPPYCFEVPLSRSVALDFYISQAEICVDMKYLDHVTAKPWGEVYEDGRSYVDKVRDEMKRPQMADYEFSSRDRQSQSISDFYNKLEASSPRSNHSVGGILKLLVGRKYSPRDFITKCITYDKRVVIVLKKIEVSTADPNLLSALTKLDSLTYLVGSFLENMQKVTPK